MEAPSQIWTGTHRLCIRMDGPRDVRALNLKDGLESSISRNYIAGTRSRVSAPSAQVRPFVLWGTALDLSQGQPNETMFASTRRMCF